MHSPRIGKKKLCQINAVPPRVREIAWKAQTRLTARYPGRLSLEEKRRPSFVPGLLVNSPGSCGPPQGSRKSPEAPRTVALRARAEAGSRQGNSRQTLCGRLKEADARCKIGTAPDAFSGMRFQPAHKSLITDVRQILSPPVRVYLSSTLRHVADGSARPDG